MEQLNILSDNAKIFATHISHEGNPMHSELEEYGKSDGYKIADDGLVIEV
jgi:phosphoribosyl 1,2-cyclic phosphate phosphodiesterase